MGIAQRGYIHLSIGEPMATTAARKSKQKSKSASKKTAANENSNAVMLVIKEGTLLAILVVALFCLLALLTFSPQDPGWSATGSDGNIRNIMGATGAWVSDALFSMFGFSAYVIPAMLLYRGWLIFRNRHNLKPFDSLTLGLKLTGALLLCIGLTSLFALSSLPDQNALPFSAGGYIGLALSNALSNLIGSVGTTLLMLAMSLFGLTLFAEVSWLSLMDKTGGIVIQLNRKILEIFSDWQQTLKEILRQKMEDRKAQKIGHPTLSDSMVKLTRIKDEEESSVMPKIFDQVLERTKQTQIKLIEANPKKKNKKVQKRPPRSSAQMGDIDLPTFDLLDMPTDDHDVGYSAEELQDFSNLLELKLLDFGIKAEVKSVMPGPVITRFEIQPAAGVKVSRISNLVKDLARSLAVISVRVVEVIAGKSYVGIEIPNANRAMVMLSDVLMSETYQDSVSPLTLALGHDIAGQPVVADLARMPHLLVAGTTGSGKSVGINAMLLSLLYKATPADVRLILIDPKMLELNVYEGIPHLLSPVITDMKDAANGLRWCVAEMERRYRLMASLGVRNLVGFNKKVKEAQDAGDPLVDPTWKPDELSMIDPEDQIAPDLDILPSIVVVIDEFADMMMIVGKKVEQLIARIAQKARAAGIHLILATQRPSVDVITGLIKANVPTRIAFQVSSRVDSRTILDQGGAEQLLGHGDMLYLPPGTGMPIRVHGAFVSDDEVHRVCDDWRSRAEPDYISEVTEGTAAEHMGAAANLADEDDQSNDESDPLYDEAVAIVTKSRKASISSVQRKLRIGYNRAARLIETMEAAGVVSEMGTNGAREVLAPEPPR